MPEQTAGKLAESLWWILVLARRLGIEIDEAYATTMDRIEQHLDASLARTDETR